jgi:molecular chaperone DnaK (HSP70)
VGRAILLVAAATGLVTISAAGVAGLSVLRVLSEPVAAAIAYDLDR